MAAWYGKHFALSIVRHMPQPHQAHFLADSDATVLEIYCNPPDKVPNYRAMDPLLFHVAFLSTDPAADAKRLMGDGATWVSDVRMADGSYLVMLRDPWGLALQLCKRATPLLPASDGR